VGGSFAWIPLVDTIHSTGRPTSRRVAAIVERTATWADASVAKARTSAARVTPRLCPEN
jgi:hypothetical protein